MSNPIDEFLQNRLNEKSKGKTGEKLAALEAKYEKRTWIADAARRASQLDRVTHPGKFSHPDSKISSLLVHGTPSIDGLVRTGNVRTEVDVVGNAAALDVYTFLMLQLEDGKTILEHFRARSETLRHWIGCQDDEYQEIAEGFLQVETGAGPSRTSGDVKQIYFPVGDGYHLLSIVTSSGLLSANCARVRDSQFADDAKAAREARKKNVASAQTIMDFQGNLTMHFGGTKPQNISKLNSNNGGRAYLFRSMPPDFAEEYVRVPRQDFFSEQRWDRELRDLMLQLHSIFILDWTNVKIRMARRRRTEQIVDWLLFRAYRLQQRTPGWSDQSQVRLPVAQVVWLDRKHWDRREEHGSWSDEIDRSVAEWILVSYRKTLDNRAVKVGLEEQDAFRAEVRQYTRDAKQEWI